MTEKNDRILSYCGLYCGGCHINQSTQKGVKTELDPGTFVTCDGCNSKQTTPWCTDCAIKICGREKGLRYCLRCPDYPCGKMTDFINDPKYPYHTEVPANMQRLEEIGFEAWCAEQEERWLCGVCKGQCHWFGKQCSHCGADLA